MALGTTLVALTEHRTLEQAPLTFASSAPAQFQGALTAFLTKIRHQLERQKRDGARISLAFSTTIVHPRRPSAPAARSRSPPPRKAAKQPYSTGSGHPACTLLGHCDGPATMRAIPAPAPRRFTSRAGTWSLRGKAGAAQPQIASVQLRRPTRHTLNTAGLFRAPSPHAQAAPRFPFGQLLRRLRSSLAASRPGQAAWSLRGRPVWLRWRG